MSLQYFVRNSLLLCIILCSFSLNTFAQKGQKVEYKITLQDQDSMPIIGADIVHLETQQVTSTDEHGQALLEVDNIKQELKIVINSANEKVIEIDPSVINDEVFTILVSQDYNEVVIVSRKKSTTISLLGPIKVENLNSKELLKAACCNLSESFETTPSIDAGFTDAVSGFRQISMLGLSGPNVMITRENIPDIRGLASITGFTFTPGPWVESIQISKGTGSVVNGYEGTAGQINIELHKFREQEGIKLLANAYQSGQGRSEGNLVYNKSINHDLNTTIMAHVKSNWMKVNQNDDDYLDQPLGETVLLANRWSYLNHDGWEFQLGLKGVLMNLWGGQMDYQPGQENSASLPWGFENSIKRGEFWSKIGKVNPRKPYQSMGLQIGGTFYDLESSYGLNEYNATNNSLYFNYIYQSIISNTNHVIKFGGSLLLDNYAEDFSLQQFNRKEVVPGIFAEYAYNFNEKFNVVAGLRLDDNNLYGAFVTPRLHMRYALTDKSTIRASFGRAQRTANVISENIGFLSSSRLFEFTNINNGKPYGLDPEVAWNMGVNYTQNFILNYKDGSFGIDYYYTSFENMVVADFETYDKISFYNMKNGSTAHSFQAQLDYEPFRNFDVRVAYRFYDVKMKYQEDGWKEKPLLAKNRFFVNLAYETSNFWYFDFTANWTGTKRMVQHFDEQNPSVVKQGHTTPSFWIFNTQISKAWLNDKYRVYFGVENIANTMQHHLIINPNNPYSKGFDAGLIWGSAMGRNIYAGFNFKLM